MDKTIIKCFSAAAGTNNSIKSWKQVSLSNTKIREYLLLEHMILPPLARFSTIPAVLSGPNITSNSYQPNQNQSVPIYEGTA